MKNCSFRKAGFIDGRVAGSERGRLGGTPAAARTLHGVAVIFLRTNELSSWYRRFRRCLGTPVFSSPRQTFGISLASAKDTLFAPRCADALRTRTIIAACARRAYCFPIDVRWPSVVAPVGLFCCRICVFGPLLRCWFGRGHSSDRRARRSRRHVTIIPGVTSKCSRRVFGRDYFDISAVPKRLRVRLARICGLVRPLQNAIFATLHLLGIFR